jgi:protein TonB
VSSVINQLPGLPAAAPSAPRSNSGQQPNPAPPPEAAAAQPVVGGEVRPAEVLSSQRPTYPPAAAAANIQGTVVVLVMVGTDGKVKQAKVESGHPMLTNAALTAVRTWTFRPALLNGNPVEAPARVELNFHRQR